MCQPEALSLAVVQPPSQQRYFSTSVIPFTSPTDIIVACQQFALSEGYVINKRSLEETRGKLRLKCDHNCKEVENFLS
jgi:hypothetical protein